MNTPSDSASATPPPAHQNSVLSPCIQICRIDPLLQLCLGCGRTMDEIGRWSKLSDPQRLQVMDVLPDRMKHLKMQRKAAGIEDQAGGQ
ncbi:MAG: DUF1289 domain-containing protein [Hyphomicrobiales bacterium]